MVELEGEERRFEWMKEMKERFKRVKDFYVEIMSEKVKWFY